MVDFLSGPAAKIEAQVNRELIEISKNKEDKRSKGGSTKWGLAGRNKDGENENVKTKTRSKNPENTTALRNTMIGIFKEDDEDDEDANEMDDEGGAIEIKNSDDDYQEELYEEPERDDVDDEQQEEEEEELEEDEDQHERDENGSSADIETKEGSSNLTSKYDRLKKAQKRGNQKPTNKAEMKKKIVRPHQEKKVLRGKTADKTDGAVGTNLKGRARKTGDETTSGDPEKAGQIAVSGKKRKLADAPRRAEIKKRAQE